MMQIIHPSSIVTVTITVAGRRFCTMLFRIITAALFLLLYCSSVTRGIDAFSNSATFVSSATMMTANNGNTRPAVTGRRTVVVMYAALSERQMQFWEDVEDGLDDIEQKYGGSVDGQTTSCIDRIREFGKSARGDIACPKGLAPLHQPSEENVPDLTAKPFWDDIASDTVQFPWASQLESNFETVLHEFQANLLTKEDESDNIYSGDSAWQNQVMGKGWSAFRLQRLGIWNKENCQKFPQTYELLRALDIPLAVRGVCFARQAPGSGVASHSDGRNFILTAQLGLKIPTGCWIEVGNVRQTWQEGKITTVDTSFEHSTGNPNAKEDRYVLIIDFWHPELTEAERAGLELVYDLRNRFENGQIPVRRPRGTLYNRKKKKQGSGGFWASLMGG